MPGTIPTPTGVFHLTSVANLRSIAACSAVYSKRTLTSEGIAHADISNSEIQARRAEFPVACGPGGTLHDYVPFFFNPKSPMLYRKVRDYNEPISPASLAHIVTTAQSVENESLPYVFTTGHAIMMQADYHESLDHLDKINWDVVRGKYWFDSADYPNRQCSREAEFLVHGTFPIAKAHYIAVYDRQARSAVADCFAEFEIDIPVRILPNHFYSTR